MEVIFLPLLYPKYIQLWNSNGEDLNPMIRVQTRLQVTYHLLDNFFIILMIIRFVASTYLPIDLSTIKGGIKISH